MLKVLILFPRGGSRICQRGMQIVTTTNLSYFVETLRPFSPKTAEKRWKQRHQVKFEVKNVARIPTYSSVWKILVVLHKYDLQKLWILYIKNRTSSFESTAYTTNENQPKNKHKLGKK